jgi:hypothetical protein
VLPNCLELDGVTVGGRGARPKDADKPETDTARAKSTGKLRPAAAGPPPRPLAFRPVAAPTREPTHAAGRYHDRSKNRRIAMVEAAATAADRRRQVRFTRHALLSLLLILCCRYTSKHMPASRPATTRRD